MVCQKEDHETLESFMCTQAEKYGLFLKGLALKLISIIVTLAHEYGKNHS